MQNILIPDNQKPTLSIDQIKFNTETLNAKLQKIGKSLEEDLANVDVESLNPDKRGYPKYLDGTFDKNGIPVSPKLKQAYQNIVLGMSRINLFEGGVRGGKDVLGIALFSELLMIHPASTFLVLGVSLEHAIRTVFDSDGFGILYTIPHGRLSRESIDGAQRVVYRYKNYMGIEKKILIYGNANQSDYKKYQGFSIGATYVNEGTNQHLKGITEALERMIASPMPVMVITQNPIGSMASFYKDFESHRLPKEGTLEAIQDIKDMSEFHTIQLGDGQEVVGYKGFEEFIYDKMHLEIQSQLRGFLKKKERPDYDKLDEASQVQWNKLEEKIRFSYEKQLRGVLVKDVFEGFPEGSDIGKFSWKKVIYYQPAHENPNGIQNNVDYAYYHLTIYDNKTLTDAQIEEAQQGYIKGSSRHQQRILGIRKAVDKAVWPSFDDGNIFDGDINVFKKLDTERIISIDFGAGVASYIGDYEINWDTGLVVQTRETHITPEYAQMLGRTITEDFVYKEYLKILKAGKKSAILIIDTANLHLINYFNDMGVQTMPADKRYELRKGTDAQRGFETQKGSMIGLELVNLGFDLNKIKVSADNCPIAVGQWESYQYNEQSELTGDAPVIKANDEACDTLRYVVSTMLMGASYWYNEEGEVIGSIQEGQSLLQSEERQREEGDFQSRLQEKINRRGSQGFFKRRKQGGFQYNKGGADDYYKLAKERIYKRNLKN